MRLCWRWGAKQLGPRCQVGRRQGGASNTPLSLIPVCGACGLLVNDRGQHMARVRVHAGYHPCDLVPICGHHGPAKATAGAAVVRVQRGPVAFRPYQPLAMEWGRGGGMKC